MLQTRLKKKNNLLEFTKVFLWVEDMEMNFLKEYFYSFFVVEVGKKVMMSIQLEISLKVTGY